MERNESIALMKKAFENEELGAQKGAKECLYYCSKTDSHCPIGLLVGKDEVLMTELGDIVNLNGTNRIIGNSIDHYINAKGLKEFHGLSLYECQKLQELHDDVINHNKPLYVFETYLYSL